DVDISRGSIAWHVIDDFDDACVTESGFTQPAHVVGVDLAALFNQFRRKAQCFGGHGVCRLAGLCRRHFLGAGTGLATECGVGSKAVCALTVVGNCDRDLFAEPGRDGTGAERAERSPHAFSTRPANWRLRGTCMARCRMPVVYASARCCLLARCTFYAPCDNPRFWFAGTAT